MAQIMEKGDSMARQAPRLRRSRGDRFLFGVAGGFAEFFNVDPFLIRVGWVLLTMATAGIAALMYVVLASIIPMQSESETQLVKSTNDGYGAGSESAIKIRFNVVRGVIGTFVVGIGMIILLEQLGLKNSIRWDILFPSTIIVLGVTVLVPSIVGMSRVRAVKSPEDSLSDASAGIDAVESTAAPPKRHVARNLVGVGMIVVGLISLLTELGVIESVRWDIVWPAAIVVVGLLVLLPLIIPSRR